jgi:hypothetical protein
MDFEEWLKFGFDQGWCGPAVCETHDGVPLSEKEAEEFEESDPCIHIIRLYEDAEHKLEVEDAHAASVWRATNRGYSIEESNKEEEGQ